jgi:hypothetical protein
MVEKNKLNVRFGGGPNPQPPSPEGCLFPARSAANSMRLIPFEFELILGTKKVPLIFAGINTADSLSNEFNDLQRMLTVRSTHHWTTY